MGDVIPFPRLNCGPIDGLRAAMQELEDALAELRAACDERDKFLMEAGASNAPEPPWLENKPNV